MSFGFTAMDWGMTLIGSFADHDGFNGVMLGVPGEPYHLELTRLRGHIAGRAPSADNLLVFYLPDAKDWRTAVDRMRKAGYEPVASFNPYWAAPGVPSRIRTGPAWSFRMPLGRPDRGR